METYKFDPELGGDKTLLEAPDGHSEPDANILERVGAAVKDASAFLKDSAEDAKESSITTQSAAKISKHNWRGIANL
ncbi:hypothetical protein QUA86_33270 [Microcoleus sp. F6_B6]